MPDYYRGATAALATMHGKEAVIAPAIEAHLGLRIVTPPGLDTDVLGTFTGETPRIGTMRDVAIRKARMGMHASGLGIGFASEGSFGTHPVIPFSRGGVELMVMVDDERGIIITESLMADQTNFDEAVVASVGELEVFLPRAGFPSHALVVGLSQTGSPWWRMHPEFTTVRKGITSYDDLADAVRDAACRSEDGRARVTTDMRAHMNPTRMQCIARLATLLAHRIATNCPECGAPGFGQAGPAAGVPCASCGGESIIPRGYVLTCVACSHQSETAGLPILEFAEPGDCPRCNP